MSGAEGLELPEGYTPGPWWTAAKYDGQQMGCSIIAGRTDCGPMPGSPTRGAVAWATAALNTEARRCESNARLIALAPQMADEIAALRARLADLEAELEAARTLPEHDVALVAALREEGRPECIAAADRIETLVTGAQALLADYHAALVALREREGTPVTGIRVGSPRVVVTPEMVERALDESNPYWRNYGARLREVERKEMRATLEAAMGGGDARAAAQEAKP